MAVRRWDPFTVLARLDDDFDEMVRRTWGATTPSRTSGYVPAIDMATEGQDVVITLELPGVDIDRDVDIEVHEGRLTISGERREADRGEEGTARVLVRELRYGAFRREFALPDGVSADDVEATYDRGLLQVRVRHVTRPVEQPRKITVRTREADEARTIEGSVEPGTSQS